MSTLICSGAIPNRSSGVIPLLVVGMAMLACASAATAQEKRVALDPKMVTNEATWGNPEAMCDEQEAIGDPPANPATSPWLTEWKHAKEFPISAHIDLGNERHLSVVWVYDINDSGELEFSGGSPGKWQTITTYKTDAFKKWVRIPLETTTRYLRVTRKTPGAQFAEIALYEYTREGFAANEAKKKAEGQAREERRVALAKAQEEVKSRPMVDAGEPFGKLTLVDEIDCAAERPDHAFAEAPKGASRVEEILGAKCRVLALRPGEAAYVTWRIGKYKMLKPGAAYVLSVEYPEDGPRSMIVMNNGCETARGFHTGATVGDALRAKYVWSNPESLKIPLSGKWQTWTQFFHLHDRFPELGFIRGSGVRKLTPDDGFPVTIAQFSAENDPVSRGIAVRRIRLFEVAQPRIMDVKLAKLPEGLPQRRIFWREEMADGVIDSAKPEERGLADALDWYRYKASLMHFLGINTFTKDLLEFGACQHWDSTPGGGNNWVFFADRHKALWGKIVELMGKEGFAVLPYYEYAGSRGYKGLGNQRRCKPLTRDDAYTHIKWIEAANADITDPETRADFAKMLDLTVMRFKEQAQFAGIWIRPRMQLPISFGAGALERFSKQANGGKAISRKDLIADKTLKQKYYDWWFGQRRTFLEDMRDRLRAKSGVNPDAIVLFTADASEPGVSFPSWERRIVTDDPAGWAGLLAPGNTGKDKPVTAIGFDEVIKQDLYMKALTSAPLNWGAWEVSHASPAADPERYRDAMGVMMTHGFNRAYTVASPGTFDAFRTGSGLAVVRHYPLNEHMMFDKAGKDLLGYFVADIERAGPYCMMAEVRAMASGDPFYIGYLSGNCYNRGFAQVVREFNAAFLALPALPSRKLEGAASDTEVVVRVIETPKDGTWMAVINTGLEGKTGVKVKLPRAGTVSNAVSGEAVAAGGSVMTVTMRACEMRSYRIR